MKDWRDYKSYDNKVGQMGKLPNECEYHQYPDEGEYDEAVEESKLDEATREILEELRMGQTF